MVQIYYWFLWVTSNQFPVLNCPHLPDYPSRQGSPATTPNPLLFQQLNTRQKGEWKWSWSTGLGAWQTPNLRLFLKEGNRFCHKSFPFLLRLINPPLLSGQTNSSLLLTQKKKTLQMGSQSPGNGAGLTECYEILLEGVGLLTWLMKLYLNLVDLGLQRHFSLLRASRMKGVCYLYQTPRLKWFSNWPLCNRWKVAC